MCDQALSQKVKLRTDTGEVIYKYTSAITAVCEASFQVLRTGNAHLRNEACHGGITKLQHFAKKTIAMRRRYQRTRDDADLRQERRLQYQEGNRTYQAKLREAKLKSWKDFCSRTQSFNLWN